MQGIRDPCLLLSLLFSGSAAGSLAPADGLDRARRATAEHVARRLTQCQTAMSCNCKNPGIVVLGPFLRHDASLTGMIMAPTLQASIAASQKDESQKHIPPDIVSDSGTPDVIPTRVFQPFWL